MSKVAVIAKIPTKPGQRDEFLAAFEQGIRNAEAEDGTLVYIAHADGADENLVWVYELYTDQAALDAHSGSEAFKALLPLIGPFIGGAPELVTARPVMGKGL